VAAVSFSLWGRNFSTKTRTATSIEHRRHVRHTNGVRRQLTGTSPGVAQSRRRCRFVVDTLQNNIHKRIDAVIVVMLTAENDGRCRAHYAEKRPVNRICLLQAAHGCAGNVMRQTTKTQTTVTPTVGDVCTARPTWFGLAGACKIDKSNRGRERRTRVSVCVRVCVCVCTCRVSERVRTTTRAE